MQFALIPPHHLDVFGFEDKIERDAMYAYGGREVMSELN